MPLYDYKCPEGHVAKDVFHKMNHPHPICCPTCGKVMEKLPSLFHSDLVEFGRPIDMYSVAVEDPEDIHRLQKMCPDADISDDPANEMYGVPVARNRKAKLQVLAASGYRETN